MAWTPYQIFLAVLMATSGSINTLSGKWADVTYSVGSDGSSRLFNHSFLQADGMFIGEMMCLVSYLFLKYKNRRQKNLSPGNEMKKFNPLIFLPAAMLDMTGTSIMYVGLNLTYASSMQMLRGAVIIFVGILSVLFLKRKLRIYHWVGMLLVILGLAVVGIADIISPGGTAGASDVALGDGLIVLAQVFTAIQMVYEEKFLGKYNVPPLLAVGLEGVFGFTVLSVLLVPMYYIHVPDSFGTYQNRMEDALDGFTQLGNSWQICVATVGNMFSIAFFNFAGISVTKELNATTRMVLDSIRTVVVWVVGLGLNWQDFHAITLAGFFALLVGMCVYNEVLIIPYMMRKGWIRPNNTGSTEPLSEPDLNSYGTEPTIEKTDTPDA